MAASRYPTTQYLSGEFVLSAGSVLFRRRDPDRDRDRDRDCQTSPSTSISTSISTSTSTSPNPHINDLEICLLQYLPPTPTSTSTSTSTSTPTPTPNKKEWLLPKGRKDRGESLEQAAVRETYEETGWRCALWPRRMGTFATVPVPVPVARVGGGAGMKGGGQEDGDGEGKGDGEEGKEGSEGRGDESTRRTDVNEHEVQFGDDLVEPIAITVRDLNLSSGLGDTNDAHEGTHTNTKTKLKPKAKIIFWYITLVLDNDGAAQREEGTQTADEHFESEFVGVEEAMARLTFAPDREVVQRAVEIVLSQGRVD